MNFVVKPNRRPDWYDWRDPPAWWCQQNADVPGLQWAGNGERIVCVTMHRSHLPLLPQGISFDQRAEIEARHRASSIEQHLFINRGITLREHQSRDLDWLLARRGSLLAYEMRLGKTLAACAAHDPQDGMLVVVGPLASRDVWRQWIERVHDFMPFVLTGRKDVELHPGYPAYFIHYDILDAHLPFFTSVKIGTLVLDEVHLLQGKRSKRLSACNTLSSRSSRIIGLTGTPVWNTPDSMYQFLQLIMPGAWGAHFPYARRYCDAQPGAHGWSYSGVSCEDEFKARLDTIVLRRTWKDVAPHLPPTTVVVEPVEVPIEKVAKAEAKAMHEVLASRKQVTAVGYLAKLRRTCGELKIPAGVETAQNTMRDGHKVVLWVWHNEIGDKLVEALHEAGRDNFFDVFRLQAEDSADRREEQVRKFQTHPEPCVMVAAIAVGGVAIDLSAATHAVFVEFDWTPANLYQAMRRTFNPSRPDCVVFLQADVPIEQKLVQALGIKDDLSTRIGLGFDEIAKAVLT